MAILTGQVFGRLTVLGPAGPLATRCGWRCRCTCGVEKIVRSDHLTKGEIRSCGCLRFSTLPLGGAKSPEFWIWIQMRERCLNPKNVSYKNYGGRGISVCEEWRNDFAAFALAVGPRPSPSHTLDRIDNDKGYEPGNVRWATRIEQNNNNRKNKRLTCYGESRTMKEWARLLNLPYHIIQSRSYHGWSDKAALLTPVKGG